MSIIESLSRIRTTDDEYDTWDRDVRRARMQASFIAEALGEPDYAACFRGRIYIDIACGCDVWYGDARTPAPILFAALHGARAYGIDKFSYSGEGKDTYTQIVYDLLHAPPWDLRQICGVEEASIVSCVDFIDTENTYGSSLHLIDVQRASHSDISRLDDSLWNASWDVLVPGGIFLYNMFTYRKGDSQWERV